MPTLLTDAIVLHVFDYSETSRILRLATRDAGVMSVIARGARRSTKRFGSALDLFAEGVAQLHLKVGRDLQTLAGFDVVRARPALALDLGRFTSASAVAELMLRFGGEDAHPTLFDAFSRSLDAIAEASSAMACGAGLAGAWRLVAELGFAPSLQRCSACHAELDPQAELRFSNRAGGVLCAQCAPLHPLGRLLPAAARSSIASWTGSWQPETLDARDAQAHQRLLREFLQEHLADGRSLRAFDVWEHGEWGRGRAG
ncbi:MAG: DNA repair protein RecO [Gemmatimonadota bacterium]|nr:DNA repair protein RecO [Gemmatimonadota bacterium]